MTFYKVVQLFETRNQWGKSQARQGIMGSHLFPILVQGHTKKERYVRTDVDEGGWS